MTRARPAPLWRFGWAGFTALAVGGSILAAELLGAQFLRHAMELTSRLVGWPAMTSLLFGLYGALERYGDWSDPQGLPPGAHPLAIAALAVGMVIGERPRRWWVLAAITAVSLAWRGSAFAGGSGVFHAFRALVSRAVSGDVAVVLWLWAPLAATSATVALWSRPGRLGWWLAGLTAAALLILLADAVPAVQRDPLVAALLPGLRWAWLVAWWAWAVRWGLAERRSRFPAAGLCPACGYDLSGIPGPCPECGGPSAPPQQPCSKASTKSS